VPDDAPFVQGKHGLVDCATPLSKWTVTNAFDTAAQCENFRGTFMIFDQKRSAQDPTTKVTKCSMHNAHYRNVSPVTTSGLLTIRSYRPRIRASRRSTMGLRHAAALALMGWYLMVPPPLPHSRGHGQIEPLSRWIVARTFESKKACDAERRHLSKLDPGAEVAGDDPPAYQVYDAECFATDDPRLKEK